jgi:D-galactarolactone cycloisomerase
MKIERFDTFVLKVPTGTNTFYSSQAAFPERSSLLVKVTTDEGLLGWGEGGQYGPPEPVATAIIDVLAPRLLGREADQPVRIWEDNYAFSRDFGQKGTYVEAMSAIDIALWDIWGKSLDRPVHHLLGGAFRQRAMAYATGCYYPENYQDTKAMMDALAEEVAGYADAGITAAKIKIGLLSVEQDRARIALIRNTVGPDVKLMADANHAYNSATALRIGRVMEEHSLLWFEEPVPPEDHDGYRRLRAALDVPIAGGECEFTRFGFRDLIGGGCVDIVQPDLCCCGGFSEWTKILGTASQHGVLTMPHVWGSGVAVAAALQAIATIPPMPHTASPVTLQNEPMVEFDRTFNPLRDEILHENFAIEDGAVAIPSGPGLGISVDEKALERFVVRRGETATAS